MGFEGDCMKAIISIDVSHAAPLAVGKTGSFYFNTTNSSPLGPHQNLNEASRTKL
ncbi:hypothetical protein M7I_3816 [Glarea lozoyensis 74030]|uniref:Uncharacterized protein n=1 Tax=Glarea lozoyensis (strain ATCC 74030 / MF5533) TaxID=1104152 RepID=H0EMH9_GLAL7|nr:hypothetical protein M7I_3816 [Glarea lozoyensis 74030]